VLTDYNGAAQGVGRGFKVEHVVRWAAAMRVSVVMWVGALVLALCVYVSMCVCVSACL
jgi:hypothetical protein